MKSSGENNPQFIKLEGYRHFNFMSLLKVSFVKLDVRFFFFFLHSHAAHTFQISALRA